MSPLRNFLLLHGMYRQDNQKHSYYFRLYAIQHVSLIAEFLFLPQWQKQVSLEQTLKGC